MSPPSCDSSSALSISGASAAAIGRDPSAREPWPRSDLPFNVASVPVSGSVGVGALSHLRNLNDWRSVGTDAFSGTSHPACRAPYQAQDEQQHHRPDERHEYGATHAAEWRRNSERAEQPATDERSDDADDDVTDDAVAGSAHHQRCQDSSDQSHHDPGDYSHCVRPRESCCALRCGPGCGSTPESITKKERPDEGAPFSAELRLSARSDTRTNRTLRLRCFPDSRARRRCSQSQKSASRTRFWRDCCSAEAPRAKSWCRSPSTFRYSRTRTVRSIGQRGS